MPHIALVTYLQPDGTRYTEPDAAFIAAHAPTFAAHGLTFAPVAWDDPHVDWRAFDALLLKSPWNYHEPGVLPHFSAWLNTREAEGTPVWNPPPVIRWNLDKAYLPQVAARGVPTIPTLLLPAGTPADDWRAHLTAHGWREAVLKPTVSAGGDGVTRARADGSPLPPLASPHLLQPLMSQITTEGEYSLVFFADAHGAPAFSHAVLKRPADGSILVQGGVNTAIVPPAWMVEQAAAALAVCAELCGGPVMYARMDGVRDGDTLLLMEAELFEPSFYLEYAEATAAARLATALAWATRAL